MRVVTKYRRRYVRMHAEMIQLNDLAVVLYSTHALIVDSEFTAHIYSLLNSSACNH